MCSKNVYPHLLFKIIMLYALQQKMQYKYIKLNTFIVLTILNARNSEYISEQEIRLAQ